MNSAAAYEKMVVNLVEESAIQQRKNLFKRLTGFTKLSYHMGLLTSFYETALKLDPENSLAAAWFSDFYLRIYLPDDSIKVLEQGLESHWDTDLAYKLATLYVNESVEMSEKKQLKNLVKAERLMETLAEEFDEPEYMNLLGYILFLQGRLEEAEAVYLQCLDIEPSVDKGYYYLGKVYVALENYPEAELAMKKPWRFNQIIQMPSTNWLSFIDYRNVLRKHCNGSIMLWSFTVRIYTLDITEPATFLCWADLKNQQSS